MRPSSLVILGQVVWAIGQLAIVIILSALSELQMVGVLTLGLAIFAPLCLLGSFNLRTLIVLDKKGEIDLRVAFKLRILVAIVSLMLTGAVLAFVADEIGEWIAVLMIIATRIADHVSDVAIGYYQRVNDFLSVARSFVARGLTAVLPFSLVYVGVVGVETASVVAAVSALAVTLIGDVQPILRMTYSGGQQTGGAVINLIRSLKDSVWSSPYPMLDSLHMNSFRYAAGYSLSMQEMGYVGLAQAFYAPVQLVISAMGYSYIVKTSELVEQRDAARIRGNIWRGVVLGLGPAVFFVMSIILIPEEVLTIFLPGISIDARRVAMFVGLAMLPMGAAGFVAQNLIARKDIKAYVGGPIIGILTFLVFVLGIIMMQIDIGLIGVAVSFFLCGVIRLAWSLFFALRDNKF